MTLLKILTHLKNKYMEGHVSLTREERYQYFFYLLLLVLGAVLIVGIVFLRKRASPFSNPYAFEMQMLEQGKSFLEQEKTAASFIQTTFEKIDRMPLKQVQTFLENDIKENIDHIANISNDNRLSDPRKNSFFQIAAFYKMYLEDKKIAAKKSDNINLFERSFTECSIGFKDKQQQMLQKNAAIAARTQ